MQLLILLSAFMSALTGVMTGRVAVPQPVVSSSAAIETQATAPAVAAIVVLAAILGAVGLAVLPLPRPFRLARRVALYLERLRV